MKPIYFPYTYIPEASVMALKRLFGRFVVYQPDRGNIPAVIKKLEEEKSIDIRVPIERDEAKLHETMSAFETWADLHHGKGTLKTVYHRALDNPIPFFSDTSVSKIREDIKREDGTMHAQLDPELEARIFLSMAQLFDAQNESIEQDLRVSEDRGRQLIETLKGEPGVMNALTGTGGPARADGPYDRNIVERMKAWSGLFICDPDISNLFLTDRQAVMDFIIECADNLKLVLTLDNLPSIQEGSRECEDWRRDLMAFLAGLAEEMGSGVPDRPIMPLPTENLPIKKMSVKFYLSPGTPPHEFFRYFLEGEGVISENIKRELNPANTLIGFVSYMD